MNKNKLIFVVFLSIVISALATIMVTPSANAAQRGGCVTKKEFRKVHKGDSLGLVRAKVGSKGRTISTNYFSDGDVWKSVQFKQCGKSWKRSFIMMDFSKDSHEEYVEDYQCYDIGYEYECYDFGYWETVYSGPLTLNSKSAIW